MEELKAMFRVCVHIKKDGIRCNSPALKGGNFCFQHIGGSLREHTRARSIYNGPKLDFLYPGDRQSIQHNLFVVAQAMNDGHLELATANTYNRIFSTCERNLRRWEMQSQKPGPEPELPEIPEEAPEPSSDVILPEVSVANEAEKPAFSPSSNDAEGGPFKRSLSGEHNPAPSQATNVKPAPEHAEPLPKNHVILSGAIAGSEVEEPAFSPSSNSEGASFKRSLSGEHNPAPSEAEYVEQRNLSPEPKPLKLTPEEIQMFKDLETRYINDPTLADRIHDTYRQIHERRRAAAEQSSIPVPS